MCLARADWSPFLPSLEPSLLETALLSEKTCEYREAPIKMVYHWSINNISRNLSYLPPKKQAKHSAWGSKLANEPEPKSYFYPPETLRFK